MLTVLIVIIIVVAMIFILKSLLFNNSFKTNNELKGGQLPEDVVNAIRELNTNNPTAYVFLVNYINEYITSEKWELLNDLLHTLLAFMNEILESNEPQIISTVIPCCTSLLTELSKYIHYYSSIAYDEELVHMILNILSVLLERCDSTNENIWYSIVYMFQPVVINILQYAPIEFIIFFVENLRELIPENCEKERCFLWFNVLYNVIPKCAGQNVLNIIVEFTNIVSTNIATEDIKDIEATVPRGQPPFINSFFSFIIELTKYAPIDVSSKTVNPGTLYLYNVIALLLNEDIDAGIRVPIIKSLLNILPDENTLSILIEIINNNTVFTEDIKLQIITYSFRPSLLPQEDFITILQRLFGGLFGTIMSSLYGETIINIVHKCKDNPLGEIFDSVLMPATDGKTIIIPRERVINIPSLYVISHLKELTLNIQDSPELPSTHAAHVSRRVVQVILNHLITTPDIQPDIAAWSLAQLHGNCVWEGLHTISRFQSMIIRAIPFSELKCIPKDVISLHDQLEIYSNCLDCIEQKVNIDYVDSLPHELINISIQILMESNDEDELIHYDRILSALISHEEIWNMGDLSSGYFQAITSWIHSMTATRMKHIQTRASDGKLPIPFHFQRTWTELLNIPSEIRDTFIELPPPEDIVFRFPEVIVGLSPEEVAGLSPYSITYLPPEIIATLPPPTIILLLLKSIPLVSFNVIEQLSPDILYIILEHVMNAIRSYIDDLEKSNIFHILQTIIPQLPPDVINPLSLITTSYSDRERLLKRLIKSYFKKENIQSIPINVISQLLIGTIPQLSTEAILNVMELILTESDIPVLLSLQLIMEHLPQTPKVSSSLIPIIDCLHDFTTTFPKDLHIVSTMLQELLPLMNVIDKLNLIRSLSYMPLRLLELEDNIEENFVDAYEDFMIETMEPLLECEEDMYKPAVFNMLMDFVKALDGITRNTDNQLIPFESMQPQLLCCIHMVMKTIVNILKSCSNESFELSHLLMYSIDLLAVNTYTIPYNALIAEMIEHIQPIMQHWWENNGIYDKDRDYKSRTSKIIVKKIAEAAWNKASDILKRVNGVMDERYNPYITSVLLSVAKIVAYLDGYITYYLDILRYLITLLDYGMQYANIDGTINMLESINTLLKIIPEKSYKYMMKTLKEMIEEKLMGFMWVHEDEEFSTRNSVLQLLYTIYCIDDGTIGVNYLALWLKDTEVNGEYILDALKGPLGEDTEESKSLDLTMQELTDEFQGVLENIEAEYEEQLAQQTQGEEQEQD